MEQADIQQLNTWYNKQRLCEYRGQREKFYMGAERKWGRGQWKREKIIRFFPGPTHLSSNTWLLISWWNSGVSPSSFKYRNHRVHLQLFLHENTWNLVTLLILFILKMVKKIKASIGEVLCSEYLHGYSCVRNSLSFHHLGCHQSTCECHQSPLTHT